MNVEVINTGTELLLGDIVNTSFQYLSRTLNDAGFIHIHFLCILHSRQSN